MLWALNKVKANSVDHDHTAAVQSDHIHAISCELKSVRLGKILSEI